MGCCRRGRTALVVVLVAAAIGASLLAWDHWHGHRDSAGTVVLWLGWFGALLVVFAAPSGGCCLRGTLSRLRRRGAERVENPYRDADG